jgi:hypothetical protein
MNFLTESVVMFIPEKGQKCKLDSEKKNQWVCKSLHLSVI